MSRPDGTYEWIALSAAAIGVLALILMVWVAVMLWKIRRGQKIVLGSGQRNLVDHAEAMQREFVALRDWVDDASSHLDTRMSALERRLDGAVTHTAMLRYDAFGAMSGKQSSSVALLDEHRNGVVLSAITHRSHSHLYVKQLVDGKSDIELSPEELHVVELAFAQPGEPPAPPPPAQPTRVVSEPDQDNPAVIRELDGEPTVKQNPPADKVRQR